jgi:hypothetical protein
MHCTLPFHISCMRSIPHTLFRQLLCVQIDVALRNMYAHHLDTGRQGHHKHKETIPKNEELYII